MQCTHIISIGNSGMDVLYNCDVVYIITCTRCLLLPTSHLLRCTPGSTWGFPLTWADSTSPQVWPALPSARGPPWCLSAGCQHNATWWHTQAADSQMPAGRSPGVSTLPWTPGEGMGGRVIFCAPKQTLLRSCPLCLQRRPSGQLTFVWLWHLPWAVPGSPPSSLEAPLTWTSKHEFLLHTLPLGQTQTERRQF